MKKTLSILAILFFVFGQASAQDILTLTQTSSGIKKSTKRLRKGKTYEIKFDEVHEKLLSLKTKIVSYDLVSTSPEVLKFLSIPSTASLEANSNLDGLKSKDFMQIVRDVTNEIGKLDVFYTKIVGQAGNDLEAWPDVKLVHSRIKQSFQTIGKNEFGTPRLGNEKISEVRALLYTSELLQLKIENDAKNSFDINSYKQLANFWSKRTLLKEKFDKYIKAIAFYNDLVMIDNDDTKVTSIHGDSFKVKGDETQIDYALQNKLTGDTVIFGQVRFPTYHRWTLDFSSGFYWNQLTSESFSLREYNADSTLITFQEDYDRSSDIAVGAQLNLSYMIDGFAGIGINTGAAVSLVDGNTKYLIGGHLKLGHRKQVMISYGVAFGKVKRVSDVVSNDGRFVRQDNTIVVPAQFAELKLVDKVESSAFIGLSYNLSAVLKKRQ
tara:strand:- start:5386 stop:6696 length:1311 start_codon:yes stop_codon:yes gene_type:complete